MSNMIQTFQEIFPHWWLVVELVIIMICLMEPKKKDKERGDR